MELAQGARVGARGGAVLVTGADVSNPSPSSGESNETPVRDTGTIQLRNHLGFENTRTAAHLSPSISPARRTCATAGGFRRYKWLNYLRCCRAANRSATVAFATVSTAAAIAAAMFGSSSAAFAPLN